MIKAEIKPTIACLSEATKKNFGRPTTWQERIFGVSMVGSIVLAALLQCCPQVSQAHQAHAGNRQATHKHQDVHIHPHSGNHEHTDDQDADDSQTQPPTPIASASEAIPISLAGPQVSAFAPFAKTVSAHVDAQHLVVESNGLPEHQMMVGIVSWQQQVPLPQPFIGDNAWRLPLLPLPADKPISVLKEPLGGAIALAVNGVPIFSALNNRGEDTLLAGELDEFGGHCGRGDDYHYHTAPVHLEKKVGIGNPIAYALDGYPILGFTEADGSMPEGLDEFNGHQNADGNYHYHATKIFPYINGGLKGVVTLDGNQVKQPRDSPTRPSLQPLRGATITGFNQDGNQYDLEYEVAGSKGHVKYSILDGDQVEFSYAEPSGETSTATYHRGRRENGGELAIYLIVAMLLVGVVAVAAVARRFKRSPKGI